MRIALDFDGTIADAVGAKLRYARERFGVELTAAASMRAGAVPLMGLEAYEQMIEDVFGTELSLAMEPMPGAIEAMRRLQRRHELHVVTARWDREEPFARRWLEDRGVEVRSIVATNRSPKVEHCTVLGAHVLFEDSPVELAHFARAECATRIALLETPYNAGAERGEHWHVVPDWPAFERLVEHLAPEADGPR